MARKRFIPTSNYALSTTKGHSVLRQRHYSPAFHRRPVDDLYVYEPTYVPRPSLYSYDTSGNENYNRSEVNRELLLSTAAMEDSFDIASKSRNRDRDVLSAANKAIPLSSDAAPVPTTSAASYSTESRHLPSLRRSTLKRSISLPPGQRRPIYPSYKTTTTVVPLDLSASPEESRQPYLNLMKQLDTTRSLNDGSYEPQMSSRLHAGYISPAALSPFGSPGGSGTQTPVEYEYSSPLAGGSLANSVYRKRHKPRVFATKRRVGNYYDRLLQRRATQSSNDRSAKYWPYINVEDIEDDNTGDLFSDTESYDGGETYYVTEGATAAGDYDDEGDVYYETENIPEPLEYIPFRPRHRITSADPEEDSSYYRRLSDMSVVPYLARRDPTKTSVSDDIAFNAIVAASAARARRALQDINLDEYDTAGLVLSVEGEYTGPKSEVPVGFKYVSRPLTLKTPASSIVSAYDSDNCFDRYITNMQRFREEVRDRLDEGYKALSVTVPTYTRTLPSTLDSSSLELSSTSIKPYRRRLRDDEGYKYGRSLELYPLSTRQSSRELLSSTEPRPESHAVKLYDSDSDPQSRISTLAKIQIKVATETHSSPRSAVAARRAQRGHAQPVVYSSPKNVQKKEAALVGRKVDIVLPDKKKPKSKYAQAKMRQIKLEHRDDSPAAAGATSALRASKPVRPPRLIKPIRDVDGFKNPNNLLSWKYKLEAVTPPDDIIYAPKSLNSLRARLSDAKEKMDRHRQLMDRYLPTDDGLSPEDRRE